MVREIWIDQSTKRTRAVRVEGKRLTGIEIDRAQDIRPRTTYVAKVLRVNTALDAAELDLGQGLRAFLNLKRKPLKPGALVTVQWISPAMDDKDAVAKLISTEAEGAPRLLEAGPDAVSRLGSADKIRVTTPKLHKQYPEAEFDPKAFEMLDMENQIADLTEREVSIKDGTLLFDETAVGHVIDVNGTAKPEVLNRAALTEIARQIRLRNLSGIILIDLVGEKQKGSTQLLDLLRAAVQDDPCKVEVFGMTKLGLVEVTRQRVGYALSSLLKD